MLPLILTLSVTCVGLVVGTGVTIARDGAGEPPHPGFADLPADDGRPLDVDPDDHEPECDELDDDPVYADMLAAGVHRRIVAARATAARWLSRPAPGEQLPAGTSTTYLPIQPVSPAPAVSVGDLVDGVTLSPLAPSTDGRHGLGYVPPELTSLATYTGSHRLAGWWGDAT